MTDHQEMVQASDFRDRKIGLVVFGILQIILGGLCALAVPFMILGMIASKTFGDVSATPMSARLMIPSVLLYFIVAVWFIWMGIGSIKARRWARALVLVTSWLWLISGIGGFVFALAFMPDIYNQMAQTGQLPQEMAVIMKCAMFGFMTVFYVIVPGALVLFYGSKNVKATCEFRDREVRWTDKCPLPVLALSLIFGVWAGSMLLMGFHGWAIPFFGRILSGIRGAGVSLVGVLLLGYVALGTYRLRIKAWWCGILVIVAWALSTGITFSRVSLFDFYEKMNFPEQQLDIMKQWDVLQNSTMALFMGLWFVGFLVYFIYTRRYFTRLP